MAHPAKNDSGGSQTSESQIRRRRELARALARGGMDDVYVISHESAQEVLTPRRRELIDELRKEEATSVRDLASRVQRDHGQVSRDLKTLASHGLIDFEEDGRAKRPVLQHDHVVIEPVV